MALNTSPFNGNRRTQTKAAAMLLLILMLTLALLLALFPQPARAASLQTPAVPYIHIVRPGETLAGIATLYGVSVQELRRANNLDNRAAVLSCHPNADSTQVRGAVRVDRRPGPTVAGDNFSAAWTTTRHFEAGAYRFFARADDGVRVYVNDSLVLEDWNIHPATRSYGDVNLARGNHTVRVEYFEAEGLAAVSVWWERRH